MINLSEVTKNKMVSSYAYRIDFKNSEIAEKVKVGQFVHIKLSEEFTLRRPISICDVKNDIISIIFEIRGKGTEWLSKVKKGDMLDILGPLGNGFDLSNCGENPIFIGGGIGVPPMLLTAKQVENPTVIAGFRNKDYIMLLDKFKKIGAETYVTTDDGSFGRHGFVTDVLKEKIETATAVYACGPTPMLKIIAEICNENDVFCEVSLEERMACGVGACLVCACKIKAENEGIEFKHVCKDGPVFNSKEVAF